MQYKQLLSQQFLSNTLPHAILINGAIGSGKLELANWLIQLLTCKNQLTNLGSQTKPLTSIDGINACGQCKTCLLFHNNSYPDHLTLNSLTATIGIDDIRKTNSFLEKTAHTGHFKTVLIPDAQTMTVAAANALLKTLEEPTPNTVIILLSQDIELLLPTIISRCRLVTMKGLVGGALLKQHLSTTGKLMNDESPAFINLSHLPELKDKKLFEDYQEFKSKYLYHLSGNVIRNEDTLLKLMLSQQYALRWLEKITVNLLRDQVSSSVITNSSKQNNSKQPTLLTPQTINKLYKAIIEASKVLKLLPQANRTFVLENLYISLEDIVEQSI
jgi:DNA polymerase-3 subunit delta'